MRPFWSRARRSRRLAALATTAALLTLALLGAYGCFNPFAPPLASTTGVVQVAPEASSALGLLHLYEWCWNQRDIVNYRLLFTDDYLFHFATTDSAGNAYRDRGLNREEELSIAENIFTRGTATEPPAISISLKFQEPLIPSPDTRPGKTRNLQKRAEIAAQTLLRIETSSGPLDVNGVTRFFVVRGDSAKIPQELLDAGMKQDSTRWFIEQINDETLNQVAQRLPGPDRAGRAVARTEAQGFPPATWTFGQIHALWDDQPRLAALGGTRR